MEQEKSTNVNEEELEKMSGGDFVVGGPFEMKDNGLLKCPFCNKYYPKGEECKCRQWEKEK